MNAQQTRRFTLIKRPTGMAQRTDFEFSTVRVGEPGPGEVVLRVLYLSLDPAMRGWMNESKSYIPPVGLGEVMRAIGLGRVVASNDPRMTPGDFATGLTGVQDYAVVAAQNLRKVDPKLAPLPRYPARSAAPA
jgi:NADPH-dependent curcumin reductase CurA